MQVMPSDQTSTLPSYCPSSMARITSGAILNNENTADINADVNPHHASIGRSKGLNLEVAARRSPVWCSYKGVGRSHDGSRAKVAQFDLTGLCQQDVPRLHVPVEDQTLKHRCQREGQSEQ